MQITSNSFAFGCFILSLSNPCEEPRLPVINRLNRWFKELYS